MEAFNGDWEVVHARGGAGDLHAGSARLVHERPARRVVRFLHAERPALVLGSHQRQSDFDPGSLERAGLELARRSSGGGAVLVGPDRTLWVDFVVPAGDPLWSDDVGRATWWVGDLWAAAIERCCGPGAEVWRRGMVSSAWSSLVCFAGLAQGEVRLGGAKVVGVSQRRTSGAALLQTAALLSWDLSEYSSLLAGSPPAAPEPAVAGLGPSAGGPLEEALTGLLMP